MEKNKILKEIFISNNKVCSNKVREKWIKQHELELYSDIINWKNKNCIHVDGFSELLYRYSNNILEKPICLTGSCNNKIPYDRYHGIKHGYSKYCCKKCARNEEKIL